MSFSSKTTDQITIDGEVLSQTNSFTSSAVVKVTETVADGQTDQTIGAVTIDVSEIDTLYINSDQDVSFQTNNGGAPDDTIALLANRPLTWNAQSYYTNLLTTDVTEVFITNASGSTATVDIRVAYDATP